MARAAPTNQVTGSPFTATARLDALVAAAAAAELMVTTVAHPPAGAAPGTAGGGLAGGRRWTGYDFLIAPLTCPASSGEISVTPCSSRA